MSTAWNKELERKITRLASETEEKIQALTRENAAFSARLALLEKTDEPEEELEALPVARIPGRPEMMKEMTLGVD